MRLCEHIAMQKEKAVFVGRCKKKWHRILFVPTGALLSQVSYNEGNSVPGTAHAVILTSC